MKHDSVEAEPGVFSILLGGNSFEVRHDAGIVSVNGELFLYEPEDPRRWKGVSGAAAHAGRALIVAPMPGKIVRILVSAGDEVQAGQGIIVVEAMKMQNELKSPRNTRVTAINAKQGESVNAGAVLAVLE